MVDFFILGNLLSGTTLLRLLLTSHSKIVVPPECGFAVWLRKNNNEMVFQINSFVNALFETRKFDSWQLDKQEVIEYLEKLNVRELDHAIDCIYTFYASKIKPNVQAIGDKNNFYLNHVDLLHEMYPNTKFIHIVRDGRDVACSYRKLMNKKILSKYAPNLTTDGVEIAREWRESNERISASIADLPSILVRLEDILADTQKTMTDVCGFLNFDYEESILNFYKMDQKSGMEPAEFDE
jgi:hypothetical protein